jgi:hypothetical protein
LNQRREASQQIENNIALAQGSALKWVTKENTTDNQMTVNLEDGSTIVLQKIVRFFIQKSLKKNNER